MRSPILAPIRWSLVSEQEMPDIEAMWLTGADGLAGGYRHYSSIQSIYFKPRSIAERRLLLFEFAHIGKRFPTIMDVKSFWSRILPSISNYKLEGNEDIWYLRNISENEFSSRFQGRDARLIFETPGKPVSVRLAPEQVLSSMQLMEMCAGDTNMNDVLDFAEFSGLNHMVSELAVSGVLTSVDAERELEVQNLPDILFLGHSSFAVRSESTLVVFDPVALPGNLLAGGAERALMRILRAADTIIISHHHWDHLHFQTLCRLKRDTHFIVPRVVSPSLSNPPISEYLRSLGFWNLQESAPGEMVIIGQVEIRLFPFFGESFGLQSTFDGFTYHVTFSNHTLYGAVDACHNENGNMDETIKAVADLGELDFFFFGSSGQEHENPYAAAGLRHFSNELLPEKKLIRYHPNINDVECWSNILKPRFLIPYAEFIFKGGDAPDLDVAILGKTTQEIIMPIFSGEYNETQLNWLKTIKNLSSRVSSKIVYLNPMQGVRFL